MSENLQLPPSGPPPSWEESQAQEDKIKSGAKSATPLTPRNSEVTSSSSSQDRPAPNTTTSETPRGRPAVSQNFTTQQQAPIDFGVYQQGYYDQPQPQPMYVQQKPRHENTETFVALCLASLCLCFTLEAVL